MPDEHRKKRILVTGGAGFIGSRLCERLLELGHTVLCLDNFFTGSRHNVKHLLDEDRFELIRHDIVQPVVLDVDEIYNLACPASPVHYQTAPVKTIQTNVVGTYNMLELARQVKARLLQASTSEVYGDPEQHPQPESYHGNVNPIGHRACYDEGKRCAETLCMDYHRQSGVEVRIARIFNTYGPRMAAHDGRVVSNFCVAALGGEPLSIYGDGQQTRSFCYVDDLVEALVRLMGHEGDDAELPVNLGNPAELTMLGLAERIIRLAGSSSRVEFAPLPQDDPRQRRPDIARARRLLAWQPTVDLDTGLTRTLAWFRAELDRQGGEPR